MATSRKTPRSNNRGEAPEPAVAVQGSTLDVEVLRQIVEIVETSDITRLSWRNGRERLVILRGPLPAPVSALPYPTTAVAMVPPAMHAAAEHAPARPAQAAAGVGSAAPAAAAPAAPAPGTLVTSPFVGTFYRTPAPDQPAYVEVGTVVKKGQVLCIVEAMKLMNEIEAETAGRIAEVLVQNGQPVEFGQALFRIEPV